ncbi:arginine--tRNA ligase [symbiont of Argiope bruennichi]|uniref:arginine--tRNA ligase domain-containing protein n=1 Tax=symbiont of Argiope bruennichi TaxID=2810479 RepID=UPI003DA682E3
MKISNLNLEDILEITKEVINNFFINSKITKKPLIFNFLLPKNIENGDICCNIFLKYPHLLVNNNLEKLIQILQKNNFFEKILFNKGFLNFFYSLSLQEIFFKNIFLKNLKYKNKKVLVEYVSANPTGKLHLGHGRNGVFGDVLFKTYLFFGFNAKNNYYVNDSGKQIDILIESLEKKAANSLDVLPYEGPYLDILKNKYQKKSWNNLSKEKLRQIVVLEILEKFIYVLKKISISFETFTYESEVLTCHKSKIIDYFWKNNLIYEKDGAIWLKFFENFDYEDRVLIKQNDKNSYLIGDICCQYERFLQKYKKIIIILGADHIDYITRLKYTLSLLKINNKNWELIPLQIINVASKDTTKKMSKREGTAIDLEEFIDDIGAEKIRFFLISYTKNSPLTLDLEKIQQMEKSNSYYYCQYVFARINGLLSKHLLKNEKKLFFYHLSDKEINLFKFALSFRIHLLLLIDQNEPHNIYKFLLELVKRFHKYYESEKIISDNKIKTEIKLSLVLFIKKILEKIFEIISIKPIEKM